MWDCVPLDTMILTRRGWLKHDQVLWGDQTIGYDPATGRSVWTAITQVVAMSTRRWCGSAIPVGTPRQHRTTGG